jgi:hypothetical protein
LNTADPTTVRLSEHFLLSDFLGCNSVYRHGYSNDFVGTASHLKEARALCNTVLEPVLADNRLSIGYGYLSPSLSALTVKYQDPAKPSYHRWDAGAACDVALHECDTAPIYSAIRIDNELPVSRVITYSESPYLCLGVRKEEIDSGDHRRALYENRYVGERKPLYISYSNNPATRLKQKQAITLAHDWRGAGYPTYHGGGTQQLQHIRLSRYTMLSDFLYSTDAVREGCANVPPARSMAKFRKAGAFIDWLLDTAELRRVSIVRAYESPSWAVGKHTWSDGVALVIVAPAGIDTQWLAYIIRANPSVAEVRLGRDRRVLIALER